jgi:hypothetical protein
MIGASADRRTDGQSRLAKLTRKPTRESISKEQTLELIKRFGNDRKTLNAEAEKLKGK